MNAPTPITAQVLASAREVFSRHVPLRPRELLVVAVSGGVDSMVLLDVLCCLREQLDVRLHVAHLDHGLREDAAGDRQLVVAQAAARGVPCTWDRWEVRAVAAREGRSLEDAARQARYRFLAGVAKAQGAQYTVLGHQADDQAETVLLRLLRGSGATGLAAMRQHRRGGYIRPLLAVSRASILEYARSRHVPYRDDATNLELVHTRNRVRHQLLPALRAFNPQADALLWQTADLLGADDDYLEQAAAVAHARVQRSGRLPGQLPSQVALDASCLVEYHIAIQRRLLRRLLAGFADAGRAPGYADVQALLAVASGRRAGLLSLGGDVLAQRSGGWLLVGPRTATPLDVALPLPGELVLPDRGVCLRSRVLRREQLARLPAGETAAAVDRRCVAGTARVRSPRPGDRFQPHGLQGHSKKLSDFLIDVHWPRLLRPGLLLLTAADDQILWVMGLRTAEQARITAATREAVVVELLPLAPGGPPATDAVPW